MTTAKNISESEIANRFERIHVEPAHEEKIRKLLDRLNASIRDANRILGITAADLPELTEEDHDRLALERINYRRTK
jgi:hypothetical protein